MSHWTPSDALGFGWEKVKSDFVGLSLPIFVIGLIQGIPNSAIGALAAAFEQDGDTAVGAGLRFVSAVVGLLISAWLAGGMMTLFLKVGRGEEYSLGDVFSGGRWFVPMLITLFLVQLGTWVGLMLCIVPGIILGLGLSMAVPLVVDRDLDAIDALKESWRLTTGHKADLFLFGVLSFFVALAGVLAFCVGILPATAVILAGQAWIYLKLIEASPPDAGPAVF